MIRFESELQKIFGDKYQGCTQTAGELVEYRLKPGEVATPEELAQVEALPKGLKSELIELKAKVAEIDKVKDDILKLQDEVKKLKEKD